MRTCLVEQAISLSEPYLTGFTVTIRTLRRVLCIRTNCLITPNCPFVLFNKQHFITCNVMTETCERYKYYNVNIALHQLWKWLLIIWKLFKKYSISNPIQFASCTIWFIFDSQKILFAHSYILYYVYRQTFPSNRWCSRTLQNVLHHSHCSCNMIRQDSLAIESATTIKKFLIL